MSVKKNKQGCCRLRKSAKTDFNKQRVLLIEAKAGSSAALNRLVAMFQPLVSGEVSRYARFFDRHLLQGAGNSGLMEGLLKFDLSYKDVPKFVRRYVRTAIMDYAYENDPRNLIRLPESTNAKKIWRTLTSEWTKITGNSDINPNDRDTISKLAIHYGVTKKHLSDLARTKISGVLWSLFDRDKRDELSSPNTQPDFLAERYEPIRKLRDAYDTLSERERKILIMVEIEGYTLEEAGGKFGICKEMARRIKNNAITKLRAHFIDQGLFNPDAPADSPSLAA